jgi:hypothetical protein
MRNDKWTYIGIFIACIAFFIFLKVQKEPISEGTFTLDSELPVYKGLVREGMKSYSSKDGSWKILESSYNKLILKHFPEFTSRFSWNYAENNDEENSPLPLKYTFKQGYEGVEFNIIGAHFNELSSYFDCRISNCRQFLPFLKIEKYKPRICALAIESFRNFPQFNMYRFWFFTDDNLTQWVFRFMADRMSGVTQEKCLKDFDKLGYHGKKGVIFKKTEIPEEFFNTYNKYKKLPNFYNNFKKHVMKVKIPGYDFGGGCKTRYDRGTAKFTGRSWMNSTDEMIDDWRENARFRRAILLIVKAVKTKCNAPLIGLSNYTDNVLFDLGPEEDSNLPWFIRIYNIPK